MASIDFAFKFITTVIYIQLLWQTTGQYTTIWYDDMATNNGAGWSVRSGYTAFNFPSGGCASGTCCITNGGKGFAEWALRSTNISSYSYIRLQLHIATYLMIANSTCKVFYSYASGSSSDKILIKTIDPPDNTGGSRHSYPDTVLDLPYSPSSDTVWIWLYSDNPSTTQTDYCVWDDVYLKGIHNIETTAVPTSSPSSVPTPSPSKSPIQSPTKSPIKSPTKSPIKVGSPTSAPTPATPSPTRSPTLYPTLQPIDSQSPTRAPTNNPTKAPSADTTESPTTPPPTQPGIMTCGDEVTGSYNNAPISFTVQLPKQYNGDLEFDASRSSPLTITSLSAITGSTPVGFDADQDGIITLQAVIPGIYTFTIVAQPGSSQIYEVRISCDTSNPQSFPTNAPYVLTTTAHHPTGTPTPHGPTEGAVPIGQNKRTTLSEDIVTITPDITQNKASENLAPLIIIACIATFVCMCVILFVVYCVHRNRRRKVIQVTDSDSDGDSVPQVPRQHPAIHMRQHTAVLKGARDDEFSVSQERNAQGLLDWLTNMGFPQYFNLFMENGYESFRVLKVLSLLNEHELMRELMMMGIKKQRHIKLLMSEIRLLRNTEGTEMIGHGIPTNLVANIVEVELLETGNGMREEASYDETEDYVLSTPGDLD